MISQGTVGCQALQVGPSPKNCTGRSLSSTGSRPRSTPHHCLVNRWFNDVQLCSSYWEIGAADVM